TDGLAEFQIRFAGPIRVEHRIVEADMVVRQKCRGPELHARIVDISERSARLWLDQKPQPHRWREYPMLRLRLRARGLRRERPKHCSISAVVPDAQLYFAQLVADVTQLPQRFDLLRIGFGHAVEGLTLQVELAGVFLPWPVNPFTCEHFL